jgi:hypothetical protein
VIRVVLASAVLLVARSAAAGSTCGGSDSSSSSSSSSSYDSSSSSSYSTPSEPACVETTDIHGYRECKKFGAWSAGSSLPAFHLELGTAMRRFASPLGERTGTVTHGMESFQYRVIAPEARAALDTAVVAQLRLGVGLRHGLFVAVEGEVGGVTDGRSEAEMMSAGERGAPDISASSVVLVGGLAVVGARTRIGALDLGLEAAGGAHAVVYGYQSHYLACETTTSITEVMPALEARARAALWATPYISLGVTAGKSLIDSAWIGGVSLGLTSRAFGGR